jgi:hypothetical protein
MKQKPGAEKKMTKEAAVEKQIREMNTRTLLKMDVAKFCVLREQANAEQLKRLDYLLNNADLEYKVRKIVREELASKPKKLEAKRPKTIHASR